MRLASGRIALVIALREARASPRWRFPSAIRSREKLKIERAGAGRALALHGKVQQRHRGGQHRHGDQEPELPARRLRGLTASSITAAHLSVLLW
jgi:hypothetical protein